MPHNLVIGAKGALTVIGKASDAIAMEPEAPARSKHEPKSPPHKPGPGEVIHCRVAPLLVE